MSFRRWVLAALALTLSGGLLSPAAAQEDLIFRKSTVWKMLTPNDKLAVYGVDDPIVEGVACHYTVPEKGGVSGMFGVAEEVSEVSLSCRQIGPITLPADLPKEETVFSEGTSLIFKETRVNRLWDPKRRTLVYLAISRKVIEGAPANSISSVPLMPWR